MRAWFTSVWRFITDSLEALADDDQPANRQLEFDFEKEKRRWHYYLRPP